MRQRRQRRSEAQPIAIVHFVRHMSTQLSQYLPIVWQYCMGQRVGAPVARDEQLESGYVWCRRV